MDLPGRGLGHPAQQGQPFRFGFAGDVQCLGQAGAFGIGQRPTAAEAVQPVGGGGGEVGQLQRRGLGFQCLHDGFQRCAEGQALPLGPAHPQPLGRGGEGLVKADLLPHHAVLKAVRQVDLLGHQGVAVGVGQQPRLAGGRGELALGQPQHENVIGLVQPHLARAGQHHGVQRLWDVAEVRRAEQQPEQILVLAHGHGLFAQQLRHLVQKPHDHVPLAGGFLRRRDAPLGADGLHLCGLLLLRAQLLQAEIDRPADGLGVGVPHLAPQRVGGVHQQGAGLFRHGQIGIVLLGGGDVTETFRVVLKFRPPCRRTRRPCIGVIFQCADLFLGQGAKTRFGEGGQIFGQVGPAGQRQQRLDRRSRGAELRGGGLVAVERDVRHPELVPHRRAVFCDVAADHRDLPTADPLPHQAADGPGGGAGFFLPAGGGKEPHFVRRGIQRRADPCFQQLRHRRKAGGGGMAQIPPQQFGGGHLGPVFPGQLAELHRHLLCAGEKAHVTGEEGRAVVAEGHGHAGQRGQHGPQQPLFWRVEGIELVDEHFPPPQKSRHLSPRQRLFEPGTGQFQPVGGVHAAAEQQRLVALEDQRQFAQLPALGPAALGQLRQPGAGQARALQLVDGLGRHLAESRTPAVAVVIADIVLQFFQCAAHQHGPPRVGEGLHGAAALGGQNLLGKAREGKALHHAGQRIPQFAVDAPLSGGRELLRHQQDALLPRLGAGADAVIQQRRLAAAGTA